jgi:hypothetical protein
MKILVELVLYRGVTFAVGGRILDLKALFEFGFYSSDSGFALPTRLESAALVNILGA